MRAVWKYEIDLDHHEATVNGVPVYVFGVPWHAGVPHVLDVQMQDDCPVFWAEVDPDAEKEETRFAVVGTGHPIPDWVNTWQGTWQQRGFVWHLYSVHKHSMLAETDREEMTDEP